MQVLLLLLLLLILRRRPNIAMSLRDEALTVLTESLGGCTELSSAEIRWILKENFDRPESISTYCQKFQARQRKPGETLTALRHELVKLAREAYPEASEGMIDYLAKDQIITALESQHLLTYAGMTGITHEFGRGIQDCDRGGKIMERRGEPVFT